MRRGGWVLPLLLGMLVMASALAVAWLWSDYQRFRESTLPFPPGGMVYELPAGGSTASLARDLEARGILKKPLYFRLLARQEGKASGLKAGEYRIPSDTTPLALLELLGSGRVIQHRFTLVEGWTFNQVLSALQANDKIRHTLDGLEPTEIMVGLGRPDSHPEGLLLPDTYHSPRGAEDLQVLRRAMRAMDRFLQVEWEKRAPDLPLSTQYQALILASIVEKETGLGSERPEIAGVFVRRLRKGMKLQTDPTVIYGLGEAFDGNLRRADLKKDTLYNSYVHKGLPPTPIAMPGRAAIRAVLHPADGNSLYFVAKGDGSHQFSATLAAHNRAVRKYQLKKK